MKEEKEKKPREKKGCSRVAVTIVSLMLAVMTGVSGILGYNLLKAYRMNRYSKNIWLDNNYFLMSREEDETSSSSEKIDNPDVAESVSRPSAEVDSEFVSDVYAFSNNNYSEEILRSYADQVLYKLYVTGEISNDESSYFYNIYTTKGLSEAAKYINELVGYEAINISLSSKKLDVPYVSQEGILPNGCEAVSAVMLLKDKGYNVDPVDFVDKYLDCGKVYVKWGCRYGPDPKKQYAGDPKSEKGGWGCFAPVIVDSLSKYMTDKKFYACNLTGTSIASLATDYVAEGTPVAVWCTIGMQEINEIYQWQSYDKKQTYLYPVRQHCMVLIGYDSQYYYFLDPYNSNGEVKYPKEQVEYCYNSMGKQAVAILKKTAK